ncbi:hypothetical protein [Streptomyces sp. 6N223]|uniref:hypothetical protein n=1 Tax=Streptomyces sp. 6N223 TaxID=3457412 RepID=UPI003FD686D6
MPLAPADHEVLAVRDAIRDLLALLDLEEVQVNVEHIGTRSTIAIAPLPLDTAHRFTRLLDTHPDTRSEGLRVGTVVWDPRHRLVGEVIAGSRKRVKLCGLADGSTWIAQPSDLVPPRLVDIDAARRKAQR